MFSGRLLLCSRSDGSGAAMPSSASLQVDEILLSYLQAMFIVLVGVCSRDVCVTDDALQHELSRHSQQLHLREAGVVGEIFVRGVPGKPPPPFVTQGSVEVHFFI